MVYEFMQITLERKMIKYRETHPSLVGDFQRRVESTNVSELRPELDGTLISFSFSS